MENEKLDQILNIVLEIKADVEELKADMKEVKSRLTAVETEVSELKSDVEVLKTDVSELKSDVAILKVDVDKHEMIAKKYGVMSIPTMILFKDGKIIEKRVGITSKNELIKWINENK